MSAPAVRQVRSLAHPLLVFVDTLGAASTCRSRDDAKETVSRNRRALVNPDYEAIMSQGLSLQPTTSVTGMLLLRACASSLRNEPVTVIMLSLTVMSTLSS